MALWTVCPHLVPVCLHHYRLINVLISSVSSLFPPLFCSVMPQFQFVPSLALLMCVCVCACMCVRACRLFSCVLLLKVLFAILLHCAISTLYSSLTSRLLKLFWLPCLSHYNHNYFFSIRGCDMTLTGFCIYMCRYFSVCERDGAPAAFFCVHE